MSARVVDFLSMQIGIGQTITEFVPGVRVFWQGQSLPAPETQEPYIDLSFRAWSNLAENREERRQAVIDPDATITVPGPLPAVGTALRVLIDTWQPTPEYVVTGVSTLTTARDSLLAQIADLPPLKYGGRFSAVGAGADQIVLTPSEPGGIGGVQVQGGLALVAPTSEVLRMSGPAMFILRMQCYGRQFTTPTLNTMGAQHPTSVWSTLAFKMNRTAFQRRLGILSGVSLWGYPTGGQYIPANVQAGIEPRVVGEIQCAVQAMDFDSLPSQLREVRGTVSASDQAGAFTTEFAADANTPV